MKTSQWTKCYRWNDISQAHQWKRWRDPSGVFLLYGIIVLSEVKHKRNQAVSVLCVFFWISQESPTKTVTWLLSCVPIWHSETSRGTCSALLSERKLANLENSDVKTTSVEQTVPHRHGEWWKEKESTIKAYEAHCGQKNGMRERCYRFITVKLNTHTHACALTHYLHTRMPQRWTELNGEIAGSSRLEMRWESGQGDKELVVLFISLVQSWVGQGWREKQMTEGGREVTREGEEGWRRRGGGQGQTDGEVDGGGKDG